MRVLETGLRRRFQNYRDTRGGGTLMVSDVAVETTRGKARASVVRCVCRTRVEQQALESDRIERCGHARRARFLQLTRPTLARAGKSAFSSVGS